MSTKNRSSLLCLWAYTKVIMLWMIFDFWLLLNTSLCMIFGPNILSMYPLTAYSMSPLATLVRLCFCSSGNCLKYSMYSVLKYSFMVLKQVLRKKKSNCLACFTLWTTLTSVSTECSDDLVTLETTFSETGEGHCFSFSFISLFFIGCSTSTLDDFSLSSVLVSEMGS